MIAKISQKEYTCLQIRVCNWKLFYHFSTKTYVVGTEKTVSMRHMFQLLGKKIITILRSTFLLTWTYEYSLQDLVEQVGKIALCCPSTNSTSLLALITLWMVNNLEFWKCHQIFAWFDSLRPINNLSVIKGWVFLGWISTKLGLMSLLKDTTQWRQWGLNPRPLESSTLPLSHCAP